MLLSTILILTILSVILEVVNYRRTTQTNQRLDALERDAYRDINRIDKDVNVLFDEVFLEEPNEASTNDISSDVTEEVPSPGPQGPSTDDETNNNGQVI
jgi:hypothetical protein